MWFPFFSHFHFSRKNEEFAAIFREKRKNLSHFSWKTKKIPFKKLVKIAFFSTNFAENFNFWLVTIFGHGFSSFFKVECAGACRKCYGTLKNHQKWQNFGKKWRKSIFRFSSPIFRWKKKTKKENFWKTKIFVFRWKPYICSKIFQINVEFRLFSDFIVLWHSMERRYTFTNCKDTL